MPYIRTKHLRCLSTSVTGNAAGFGLPGVTSSWTRLLAMVKHYDVKPTQSWLYPTVSILNSNLNVKKNAELA